jgi:hypothetical protein
MPAPVITTAPAPVPDTEMLAVPAVAHRLRVPLDRLRKDLRANHAAAGLFTRVGGVRAIPARRLGELRAALAAGAR